MLRKVAGAAAAAAAPARQRRCYWWRGNSEVNTLVKQQNSARSTRLSKFHATYPNASELPDNTFSHRAMARNIRRSHAFMKDRAQSALLQFNIMCRQKVKPDAKTYTLLIDMMGRAYMELTAYKLFNRMLQQNIRPLPETYQALLQATSPMREQLRDDIKRKMYTSVQQEAAHLMKRRRELVTEEREASQRYLQELASEDPEQVAELNLKHNLMRLNPMPKGVEEFVPDASNATVYVDSLRKAFYGNEWERAGRNRLSEAERRLLRPRLQKLSDMELQMFLTIHKKEKGEDRERNITVILEEVQEGFIYEMLKQRDEYVSAVRDIMESNKDLADTFLVDAAGDVEPDTYETERFVRNKRTGQMIFTGKRYAIDAKAAGGDAIDADAAHDDADVAPVLKSKRKRKAAKGKKKGASAAKNGGGSLAARYAEVMEQEGEAAALPAARAAAMDIDAEGDGVEASTDAKDTAASPGDGDASASSPPRAGAGVATPLAAPKGCIQEGIQLRGRYKINYVRLAKQKQLGSLTMKQLKAFQRTERFEELGLKMGGVKSQHVVSIETYLFGAPSEEYQKGVSLARAQPTRFLNLHDRSTEDGDEPPPTEDEEFLESISKCSPYVLSSETIALVDRPGGKMSRFRIPQIKDKRGTLMKHYVRRDKPLLSLTEQRWLLRFNFARQAAYGGDVGVQYDAQRAASRYEDGGMHLAQKLERGNYGVMEKFSEASVRTAVRNDYKREVQRVQSGDTSVLAPLREFAQQMRGRRGVPAAVYEDDLGREAPRTHAPLSPRHLRSTSALDGI